jgi:glyoxylase-like metal-dependent hydrolase (beta-lactamase superfamily II)
VWVENGATPVAHVGVIEEMKKYETGHYGDKPGRWEESAKTRPDVAASKLKPPTLLYRSELIFDDGKHRVELLHFGVAHTHGDGWAWLPNEKILFTGDACVNGPYNYAADGNVAQWIQTLEAVKKLGAKTVCPGHGPIGGAELLEDQQAYFVALSEQVKKFAGKEPSEMQAAVGDINDALKKQERIARFVGKYIEAQIEKVFVEMGGKPFIPKTASADDHTDHALAHGNALQFRPASEMRSNAKIVRSEQ